MCIVSLAGAVQRARPALIGAVFLTACGGEDPIGIDPKGRIEVTTQTYGEHQDTDGYLVTLDDSARPELNREIGTQGRIVFRDVETGRHSVLLRQVADNCNVTSSNPQRVEVSANALSKSALQIACAAATGALRLTIVTEGADLDPDGYLATLDDSRAIPVPTNGIELVGSVAATNHILELSGIAENCTVRTGNPLEIRIAKDEVLDAQFVVECAATTGTVELQMVTEGENPDVAYVAVLVADVEYGTKIVGANATVTFNQIPPGHYWLFLYNIADNCLTQVPNPCTFDVSVGETFLVDWRITCVSGDGLSNQIVFEAYHEAGEGDLYAIGIDGSGLIRLTARPNTVDRAPHVSPSGRRIALHGDRFEIHTIDWVGGSRNDLTANVPCCSDQPAWSPDGTMIAYHSDRERRTEIYVTDMDGTNHTRLTKSSSLNLWPSWSPDGSQIAFMSDRAGSYSDIFVMNADGMGGVEQLTFGSSFDGMPAWSPDGRIAFVSDRDGNREIYVMNADGSGQSNLTNDPREDEFPAWSRDGARLAFARDSSIWLMAGDGSNQVHLTVGISPAYHPSWSP